MSSGFANLRDWARFLRRDAVIRDQVLVCDPVPLFVMISHFLSEEQKLSAFCEAINDDVGDPDDLDPRNAEQSSRLEAAVLARTTGLLGMRELVSASWWDADNGSRSLSLSIAYTPEDGLLVLQDQDGGISFHVLALGCERAIQAVAAEYAELVFPRFAGRDAHLREVVIRNDVTWTMADLAAIVKALTGIGPKPEHVVRADLLSIV